MGWISYAFSTSRYTTLTTLNEPFSTSSRYTTLTTLNEPFSTSRYTTLTSLIQPLAVHSVATLITLIQPLVCLFSCCFGPHTRTHVHTLPSPERLPLEAWPCLGRDILATPSMPDEEGANATDRASKSTSADGSGVGTGDGVGAAGAGAGAAGPIGVAGGVGVGAGAGAGDGVLSHAAFEHLLGGQLEYWLLMPIPDSDQGSGQGE